VTLCLGPVSHTATMKQAFLTKCVQSHLKRNRLTSWFSKFVKCLFQFVMCCSYGRGPLEIEDCHICEVVRYTEEKGVVHYKSRLLVSWWFSLLHDPEDGDETSVRPHGAKFCCDNLNVAYNLLLIVSDLLRKGGKYCALWLFRAAGRPQKTLGRFSTHLTVATWGTRHQRFRRCCSWTQS
jgi:hypothetical protein